MTKFFMMFLLSFYMALFSCTPAKKEEVKKTEFEIKYEKEQLIDTLNKNESTNITAKFNAFSGRDSSVKFTYQLQEILKENIIPVSFVGRINDISQKNGNYFLKIYGKFSNQICYAEILVSPQEFEKFKKQLNPKLKYEKGCFIFKPTSINSSSMLTIDSKLNIDETAETAEDANARAEAELTYDFIDNLLFLKGNLVDYYLFKTLPIDED